MKLVGRLLRIVALTLLGLTLYVRLFERRLVYYPSKESAGRPQSPFENLFFPSEDDKSCMAGLSGICRVSTFCLSVTGMPATFRIDTKWETTWPPNWPSTFSCTTIAAMETAKESRLSPEHTRTSEALIPICV